MKYKEFLNEGSGYKDFGTAEECLDYLEKYCSLSWGHFKKYGNSGLWRGVGLGSRSGEMSLCDPLARGVRKSVSGNILTNWIWNRNCDNRKYFDRDVSIMVSCNIHHVEEFGYACNVFLQDDALLNATGSDFMLSNVDEIFDVRNPKNMTIATFERAIFTTILNIAESFGEYGIWNVIKELRDKKNEKTPDKYYSILKHYWDELKFFLDGMEKREYQEFISKCLSKEVTTFFNSNGIGIRDMWDIFDIGINKNSVKSLTVENLYKGLDYDEIWTQSPIVICSGHGIKKMKYNYTK